MKLTRVVLTGVALTISIVVVAFAPSVGATTKPQLRLYMKLLTTSDLPAKAISNDLTPKKITGECSQSFEVPRNDPMVWVSFAGQEQPTSITEQLATSKAPQPLYRSIVAQYSRCRLSTFALSGTQCSEIGHSIAFPTIGNSSRAFSFTDTSSVGTILKQTMVVFRSGTYVAEVSIFDPSPTSMELESFAQKALSKLGLS